MNDAKLKACSDLLEAARAEQAAGETALAQSAMELLGRMAALCAEWDEDGAEELGLLADDWSDNGALSGRAWLACCAFLQAEG